MLDSHLVMNALNLMAARDFKERGEENALLFALSDYLQQALQHPASSALSLRDELQLTRAQINLLAELSEKTVRIEISAASLALSSRLPAGSVARVAAGLFSAALPRQMETVHIQADIADPGIDGVMPVSISLLKMPAGHSIDLPACRKRIEALWSGSDWPPALAATATWQQRQPEHLAMTYRLEALPDSA